MSTKDVDSETAPFSSAESAPDQVRRATVAAAERLFARSGIHAVSVREIAREVGVSHTLLHLYFGNKEEIVRQVLAGRNGRFASAVASAPNLAGGVQDAFRAAADDAEWLRVMASGLVEGVVPERVDVLPAAQRAFILRAAEAPTSTGAVDPRVMSVALMCMTLGWAVGGDWLREGAGLGEMTDAELTEELSEVARRMVEELSS